MIDKPTDALVWVRRQPADGDSRLLLGMMRTVANSLILLAWTRCSAVSWRGAIGPGWSAHQTADTHLGNLEEVRRSAHPRGALWACSFAQAHAAPSPNRARMQTQPPQLWLGTSLIHQQSVPWCSQSDTGVA